METALQAVESFAKDLQSNLVEMELRLSREREQWAESEKRIVELETQIKHQRGAVQGQQMLMQRLQGLATPTDTEAPAVPDSFGAGE